MIKMKDILETKGNKVWSVGLKKTVYDALQLMAEKKVGAVLVMKKGKVKGLFSERDYARKVILKGRVSKDTNISVVMTDKVFCVSPEDTAEQGMVLMTDKRIRHLPVVEDGEIVGLVSIGDLVKAIIDDQQSTIDVLERYITS